MSSVEAVSTKRLLICSLFGIVIVAVIALLQNSGKPETESQMNVSAIEDAIANIPDETPEREIQIQHWQSSLDVPIYFVSTPELPALDISLQFNAGSAWDNGLAGLANLTASLLEAGTVNKSTDQVARQIENLGSVFYTYTTKDQAVIAMRTLSDKEHLQASIDLLTEIISQPAFAEKEISRIKNRQITNIQYLQNNPDYQGFVQLDQLLFAGHPYTSPDQGTESSLKKINTEDIRDFYKQHYVARNLSIALTGNITREQAERLSDQISLALAAGAAAESLPVKKEAPTAARLHIPMDIEQLHIFMGIRAIDRNSQDYPALYVANRILGEGDLSSILMDRLREQLGLVYHANSFLSPMRSGGSFVISAQTKADQAEQTITEIQSLLKQFINDGPTEQQLIEVKKKINGQYPMRTASNSAIVNLLGEIGAYQLPLDEHSRFLQSVNALTTGDIKDAVSKALNPDQMSLVTVGPQKHITK